MKYKMESPVIQLINMLLSGNESNEVAQKIFRILKSLKEFNETFLHLVLPSFCQIINDLTENGEEFLAIEIISYIRSILRYDSGKLESR